jgi:hypothetical protein
MALTGAMQASKYYSALGSNNLMIVNYGDKGLQIHATTGKVLADTMATLKDSTGTLVAKDSVKANKVTAVWCSVGTNIVVKDTAKIKIARVDSLHIANGGKVEVGKRLYFGDTYLTEDGDVFGFSKGVTQPIQFDISNTTGNGLAIFGGMLRADSMIVNNNSITPSTGTFACTLSENGTDRAVGNARYFIVGKIATIVYPNLLSSGFSGVGNVFLKNYTGQLSINSFPSTVVIGHSGGTITFLGFDPANSTIFLSDGSSIASGYGGLLAFSVTLLLAE